MNSVACTSVIRARMMDRSLPNAAPWRCLGEYSGGSICDACGERITSAQASYSVDFDLSAQLPSARFHRVCFEIWQQECEQPVAVRIV
jgi:hypothetical protein